MKITMAMDQQVFVCSLIRKIARSNEGGVRRKLTNLSNNYGRKTPFDIKMEELAGTMTLLQLVQEKISEVLAREDLDEDLKKTSEKRQAMINKVMETITREVKKHEARDPY